MNFEPARSCCKPAELTRTTGHVLSLNGSAVVIPTKHKTSVPIVCGTLVSFFDVVEKRLLVVVAVERKRQHVYLFRFNGLDLIGADHAQVLVQQDRRAVVPAL